MRNYTLVILWLGVAGGILSLGALLSSRHLIFDLLSHFRIQYMVLLFLFACLAFNRRRALIALVLIVCLAVHAFDVVQSQTKKNSQAVPTIDSESTQLRVMTSNLLASNDDYDGYVQFINSVEPEVIVFQEYTNTWDDKLSVLLNNYPYRLTAPLESPFGIGVYSKYPLLDDKVLTDFGRSRPNIEVNVAKGMGYIKIIGIHPPPPISTQMYTERNQTLINIAQRAIKPEGALIIMGDFNISPWSAHFSDFLQAGKLTDGRSGHGLLPTWPAFFWPLQIPIDHIVINNKVNVVSMSTSRGLSSDHRALWADVVF